MSHDLIKTLSSLLDEKLEPIKTDLNSIKLQQEENTNILKALQHRSEVNKAEHDQIINDIAQLSGKLENIRKDLSTVEIVTARNMENIAQLKLIK